MVVDLKIPQCPWDVYVHKQTSHATSKRSPNLDLIALIAPKTGLNDSFNAKLPVSSCKFTIAYFSLFWCLLFILKDELWRYSIILIYLFCTNSMWHGKKYNWTKPQRNQFIQLFNDNINSHSINTRKGRNTLKYRKK